MESFDRAARLAADDRLRRPEVELRAAQAVLQGDDSNANREHYRRANEEMKAAEYSAQAALIGCSHLGQRMSVEWDAASRAVFDAVALYGALEVLETAKTLWKREFNIGTWLVSLILGFVLFPHFFGCSASPWSLEAFLFSSALFRGGPNSFFRWL
ncbi:MAG TPA: hypothetical protein VGK67_40395 [Myxococcales bacterium]